MVGGVRGEPGRGRGQGDGGGQYGGGPAQAVLRGHAAVVSLLARGTARPGSAGRAVIVAGDNGRTAQKYRRAARAADIGVMRPSGGGIAWGSGAVSRLPSR
ncbi:hypothetical protein GCM10010245_51770 [Streptomyces spectabilis]|nr:hypothetical protein GCM10010245_51770 [Streptomyces spectabilis]